MTQKRRSCATQLSLTSYQLFNCKMRENSCEGTRFYVDRTSAACRGLPYELRHKHKLQASCGKQQTDASGVDPGAWVYVWLCCLATPCPCLLESCCRWDLPFRKYCSGVAGGLRSRETASAWMNMAAGCVPDPCPHRS